MRPTNHERAAETLRFIISVITPCYFSSRRTVAGYFNKPRGSGSVISPPETQETPQRCRCQRRTKGNAQGQRSLHATVFINGAVQLESQAYLTLSATEPQQLHLISCPTVWNWIIFAARRRLGDGGAGRRGGVGGRHNPSEFQMWLWRHLCVCLCAGIYSKTHFIAWLISLLVWELWVTPCVFEGERERQREREEKKSRKQHNSSQYIQSHVLVSWAVPNNFSKCRKRSHVTWYL